MKTRKEKFNSYYHSKYPKIFQETFKNEGQAFWEEIERDLTEIYTDTATNFDRFLQVSRKINRFIVNYIPSKERKEMIITLLFKILLEQKMTLPIKLNIMSLIQTAYCRHNFKLQIKWQSIYSMFNEDLFKLSINHSFARGGFNDKTWSHYLNLARRARKFYTENVAVEVLRLFGQHVSPFFVNVSKAACLLYIFFKTSRRCSKGFLEYIPDLFELFSWKNHNWWIKIFINLFQKLAIKHLEIDWSPYYEPLFTTFFQLIKNEFPKKVRTHIEQNLEYFYKFSYFFPRDYIKTFAIFIVMILRPKTIPNSDKCWDYFERIYNSTLPFIHPENNGQWTRTLASFFSHFARAYVKRYHSEKRYFEKKSKMEMAANGSLASELKKESNEEKRLDDITEGQNSDNDQVPDIEEDDDAESNFDEYEEQDMSAYFVDEYCHEKFIKMMIKVVKSCLFSADRSVSDNGSSILRSLLYFDAGKIAPLLLDMIYDIFDRSDFKHSGVLSLIYSTSYPLFKRSVYKPGIYQIPKLLELTLTHLVSHDMTKTNLLLWFYQAIFSMIPIYDLDDLRDDCEKYCGFRDDKTIKEVLNRDEKADMWKLTEDISNWAVRFFSKFINTFSYLQENSETPTLKIRSLMITFKRFHSFIVQSSPRLKEKYLEILAKFFQENETKLPNTYLNCAIISMNLANIPHFTSVIIPILQEKMFYKVSQSRANENSKKPLYHLIQRTKVKDIFDFYEFRITNKENLLWYLEIVKSLVSFSSPAILKHSKEIQLIVFHGLMHEEHNIYKKALSIWHHFILSLISIYPTNLGSLNPKDYSKDEFLNFYRKAGELNCKNVELQWHMANEEELACLKDIIENMFKPILSYLSEKYLQEYKEERVNTDAFSSYIDSMLLQHSTPITPSQKEDIIRNLSLASYMFLAFSECIPFRNFAFLSEMKEQFERKIVLLEYSNLRMELYAFLAKFIKYSFQKAIIYEDRIARTLVDMVGYLFGIDDQAQHLQDVFNFLKNFSYYKPDAKAEKYDSRYFRSMVINNELHNKIYSYSFGVSYNDKIQELPYLLGILAFHSNSNVGGKAADLIELSSRYIDINLRKSILADIISTTNKYVEDRFKFLNENLSELEKKHVITFKDFNISKSIKDTYVDSLVNGSQRLINNLINYLPNRLDLLQPIVENLMNIPKSNDMGTLERFEGLIKNLDITVYSKGKLAERKNSIIQTNELFDEFMEKVSAMQHNIPEFYDLGKNIESIEKSMSGLIVQLASDDHWKIRNSMAILGMIYSKLLPSNHRLYDEFLLAVTAQITSKHYYLRYMAILFIPWLIEKKAKEASTKKNKIHKSPEDFTNIKLTIDEAFKYHFLLKSDYEKYYIKDSYTGLIEFYDVLKVFNPEKEKLTLPPEMAEFFNNKEEIRQFFDILVNDVQIKYDTGSGGQQGLDFQKLMQNLFNFSHKSQYIPSGSGDFLIAYGQFFLTLFKYFDGPKLLENSIDIIEEFAAEYNSREKQAVCVFYVYGVLRSMLFWSAEDREKYSTRITDMFIRAAENISQELFKGWAAAFINFIAKTDYRLIKPITDKILKNPFESKSASTQMKYLSLYDAIIKYHSPFVIDITNDIINNLVSFKPQNIKQAKDISLFLVTLFKHHLLVPINYKKIKEHNMIDDIDEIIKSDPERYILENDYLLYRYDSRIEQMMNNYINWLKEEENMEEKKCLFELIFGILIVFNSERVTNVLARYYTPIFKFFLEVDLNGIALPADTIDKVKNYVSFLAKLQYPKSVISKLVTIVENGLLSPNFRIRENNLRFFHFFYYNHIFYLADKDFAMVINLLTDENAVVRKKAFDIAVDFFKIYTSEEILKTVEKAKNLAKQTDPNIVAEGLFLMMALILSHPYENESWTEELLIILLKKYKTIKIVKDDFREFAEKYWDTHKGHANLNNISLSPDTYYELREISSSHSYFV